MCSLSCSGTLWALGFIIQLLGVDSVLLLALTCFSLFTATFKLSPDALGIWMGNLLFEFSLVSLGFPCNEMPALEELMFGSKMSSLCSTGLAGCATGTLLFCSSFGRMADLYEE